MRILLNSYTKSFSRFQRYQAGLPIPSLKRLKDHWPAAVIAGLFMLLAATYSVMIPLFESPDELWHYPFVWHLARTAELPIQDPANPQLWGQEGSQPPLYYMLAALLTAAVPADDLPALIYPNPHADIGLVSPDGNANIVVHTSREAWPWSGAVLAIHLARLFSTLLGTGTILSSYALGRLLWPEQPRLALLAMAFIAFNPMFLFISGSVNNDNLVTLLASLALWQLVAIASNSSPGSAKHPGEPSLWRFVGLGIVVGLAALTKVSGLGLLGLVSLVLFSYGLKWRQWRMTFLGPGLVSLIAIGLAGWWYWRNQRLYGDWTGVETMVLMMGGRPVSPTVEQLVSEISGLFRSFWGVFGYFSIAMPAPVYWLLNGILLSGLVGLGAALLPWPRRRPLPERFRQAWPILAGWILLMIVGLVQWTLRTPATQGRLLFPALTALAVLWAGGWLILTPPRWQFLPVATMAALSIGIPWAIIKPAYALPAPMATLPASAQPLGVAFEQGIQLLAYESPVSIPVRPGEMVPITLYWRGEQPLEIDYTVFVHLVDEYGLIVAQRDIFHGPGVYPTSQWLAGQMFGDSYTLKIPDTAFAPAQAEFAVGLYDHTTSSRLLTSTGADHVRFAQIKLEPQPGDLPNPQQLLFEDGIMLAGYNLDQRRIATGAQVMLTLYWQGQAEPAKNYKVFVHLVNSQEIRAAQHDSEPANGAAPTSSWRRGQTIIDKHPLAIVPEAPPGAYQLLVGLYEGDSGSRLRLLRNHGTPVQADAVTLSGVQVVSP
jgi:4-amino-4-deoxy-L-arabinose transferase-like glycosyltransferase